MTDLRVACYEQIEGQFWYGRFGSFTLIVDRETGYFNATKLCAALGKVFRQWLENIETQRTLAFLQSALEANEFLYEVRGGERANAVNGTYAHSSLIVHVASWISLEFKCEASVAAADHYSGRCNALGERVRELEEQLQTTRARNGELEEQNARIKRRNTQLIRELRTIRARNGELEEQLRTTREENDDLEDEIRTVNTRNDELSGDNVRIERQNDELTAELRAIEERNDELADENDDLREHNDQLGNENDDLNEENEQLMAWNDELYEVIGEHRSAEQDLTPKTRDEGRRHVLAVVRKNKADSNHPLYVIRTQKSGLAKSLKRLRRSNRYPNLQVLHIVSYDPNSVEQSDGAVHLRGLENGCAEDRFVSDLREFCDPSVRLQQCLTAQVPTRVGVCFFGCACQPTPQWRTSKYRGRHSHHPMSPSRGGEPVGESVNYNPNTVNGVPGSRSIWTRRSCVRELQVLLQ